MNLLVAGLGSIGRRHAKNLLALGATVSGCDPAAGARESAHRDLGIEVFADLSRALDGAPAAVLVCTPTHLHVPTAAAALAAGAHLFIEKPIAATLDGVAPLVAEARTRQRIVLVGCNMRFHPGVTHLRGAVESGGVGRPLFVRARFSHYLPNWRPGADYRRSYSARRAEGGGILMESVHELDYVQWLGGEAASVTAQTARLGELEIDSEDYAAVTLSLKSGAVAHIHVDYLSPLKLRGCEIVGTAGVARWVSEGKAPEQVRVTCAGADARETVLYASDAYDGNAMYVEEMRHFLACLAGSAAPCLDAEQGARVLELALMARDAAERSR